MPYIKKEKREQFVIKTAEIPINQCIDLLENVGELCDCGGDLNYSFTKIALKYINTKGESYQNYSDVISALECAKLEMYRQHVAPYEDIKIKENGDVK